MPGGCLGFLPSMEMAGALPSTSPFGGHGGFLDREVAPMRGEVVLISVYMTNSTSGMVAWPFFHVGKPS